MSTNARSARRVSLAALLVACLLGGAACGGDASVALDDGRPSTRLDRSGCAGKPGPGIGRVDARIVERPAPDRAVIEATWVRGGRAADLDVVLRLPRDAYLVRGAEMHLAGPAELRGSLRWTVGFVPGRAADAVVRLVGTTERGRCGAETYVRLAETTPGR